MRKARASGEGEGGARADRESQDPGGERPQEKMQTVPVVTVSSEQAFPLMREISSTESPALGPAQGIPSIFLQLYFRDYCSSIYKQHNIPNCPRKLEG